MRASLSLLISAALLCLAESIPAAVIYTYDFPGSPGSGLAANQTNGQPANATFGNFTRTATLTQMPGAPANNTFGTQSWNQTATIDTTEYEGFSITATGGYTLNLTSLSFDAALKPSGPANLEVGLYLNGSSTAYATLDISPTPVLTTYTLNFTALTYADNVTSAAFRFFGWNASASGGGIILDNVTTNGTIANVPEPGLFIVSFLPIALAVGTVARHGLERRNRRERNGMSPRIAF